jgi:prohibitin 2
MSQFKQAFSKFASRVTAAAGEQPPMPSGGGGAVVALTGLALGGYGVYHSMITVQPGHAGIVYHRIGGLDENIKLKEGLNFVIPWFQRAIIYDVRTKPQSIDTQSGSKGKKYLFMQSFSIF